MAKRKVQSNPTEDTRSGFEQLAEGISRSKWLSTPRLVDYVRANFQDRYTPPFMISMLGLTFSDPELNDPKAEGTALVSLDRVVDSEDEPSYSMEATQ